MYGHGASQNNVGVAQAQVVNVTRIRREIRTLSANELSDFFDALKVMRSTTDEAGVRAYGPAFRSYDYITVKHSTTAAHPCADQGHLAANQLTFHRALLLEFELSLLAIVRVDAPTSTLKALPYWNWFLDVVPNTQTTSDPSDTTIDSTTTEGPEQSWLQSSLWKHWGSPYGDPSNGYCIHDPVFRTNISSINSVAPALIQLQDAVLNRRTANVSSTHSRPQVFANGFGYWRSPWSPSDCEGLTRNPGWVYGASTNHSKLFRNGARNCLDVQYSDMSSFAACMQGVGGGTDIRASALRSRGDWPRTRQVFDFGPHNVPHVAMGTFDDVNFGYTLFCGVLAFCITLILLVDVSLSVANTAMCPAAKSTAEDSSTLLASASVSDSPTGDNHASAQTSLDRSARRSELGRALPSSPWANASAQAPSSARRWLRRVAFAVALSAGLIAPQVAISLRGLEGWKTFILWQRTLSRRHVGHDFDGSAWRLGGLKCPQPGSCVSGTTSRAKCTCEYRSGVPGLFALLSPLTGGEHNDFTGSDFWDGAFSINENFFFPIHGLYDLNHLVWVERGRTDPGHKGRTEFGCPGAGGVNKSNGSITLNSFENADLLAGRNADGSCIGIAMNDVISHEMCFTAADIGMPQDFAARYLALQESGVSDPRTLDDRSIRKDSVNRSQINDHTASNTSLNVQGFRSNDLAHNPGQPCVTHADLLRWTIEPCSPQVVPYTYDVLVEEYSYVGVEPDSTTSACPNEETVCAADPPIQFEGTVVCRRNRGVGGGRVNPPPSFTEVLRAEQGTDWTDSKHATIVEIKFCEQTTGRAKPDPPVKVCNCIAERLRAATLRQRTAMSATSPPFVFWSRCVGVVAGVIALGASSLCGWRWEHCSRQAKYDRVSTTDETELS